MSSCLDDKVTDSSVWPVTGLGTPTCVFFFFGFVGPSGDYVCIRTVVRCFLLEL